MKINQIYQNKCSNVAPKWDSQHAAWVMIAPSPDSIIEWSRWKENICKYIYFMDLAGFEVRWLTATTSMKKCVNVADEKWCKAAMRTTFGHGLHVDITMWLHMIREICDDVMTYNKKVTAPVIAVWPSLRRLTQKLHTWKIRKINDTNYRRCCR